MSFEGFSFSLGVLYGGLEKSKLKFIYLKRKRKKFQLFFQCLVFKTLDPYPDPDSLEVLDPDPDPSTTLAFTLYTRYLGVIKREVRVWIGEITSHVVKTPSSFFKYNSTLALVVFKQLGFKPCTVAHLLCRNDNP